MTEKQLRAELDVWKQRLGLTGWRLILKVGGCDDSGSYMEVNRSVLYDRAVIHVQPWLLEGGGDPPADCLIITGDDLTDDFIQSSLVHELLHLHTRDIRAVLLHDLEEMLHRDVHALAEAAMRRADEQMVDRLAEALVAAFASAG